MTRYALLLAAILLAPQSPVTEVEVTGEPHHHLVFENQSVRVFNVEIPTNSETLMHVHRHDYLFIAIGPSQITNTVKDKPPVTINFQDGDIRFSAAPIVHAVHDLGSDSFRNVTIEFMQDEALRQIPSPWPSTADPSKPAASYTNDSQSVTFPGGTQKILFIKDSVRVSQFEIQPKAVLPPQSHPGPRLLVALTDVDLEQKPLRENVLHGAPVPPPTHLHPGDSRWLTANDPKTVTTTTPAKFVTLEFP